MSKALKGLSLPQHDTKSRDAREFMFKGLELILGDDGLAVRDGFIKSSAQMEYARRWCETICRSDSAKAADSSAPAGIMLAGADTGTGKTIGYAVPLLLRAAMGYKVAIATHSHALQRQFLGTAEAPGDIRRVLGWIQALGYGDLRVARRIGRQGFISASAVKALIQQMKLNQEQLMLTIKDFAALAPVMEFAELANQGKTSGLIEDLREDLGGKLPLGITASSICLSGDSDESDFFAYETHLIMAEDAHVVIVSHAHVAACALFRRGQILNSPVDCLVIDEADRLADVASSTLRFEVSLRRCASGVQHAAGRAGDAAFTAISELSSYAQSLHTNSMAVALVDLSSTQISTMGELVATASKSLSTTIARLKNGKSSRDAVEELAWHADVLDKFAAMTKPRMATSGNAKNEQTSLYVGAISFSPVHSLPSLAILPKNPGTLMSRLWNQHEVPDSTTKHSALNSVLLTSATLGAPGHYQDAIARFKGFAAELGIYVESRPYQRPELDLWENFEPESFGAVRFILADPSIPQPVNGLDDESRAIPDETWLNYSASMIQQANKAGGRTLVLCNSYGDVERLAQILVGNGLDVIQQVRGQSTKDCEKAFLASKNTVWLSPTAWEGLNLPGAIQNLVIPRLPFVPASPIDRALLKSYSVLSDKSIDNILVARMMNSAKRKIRQGMGRPIRSKTDKARIWIADPRFPMHSQSQIPLRFPGAIRYSAARRYPALHSVIPLRFERALEYAEIYCQDGKMLK